MNFSPRNIISFCASHRRQVLITTALLAPLIILNFMVNQGEHSWIVKHNRSALPISNDFPFLTLDYMRKYTANLSKQADSLTTEEYAKMRMRNPKLPENLDTYRAKTKARLAELNAMSIDDIKLETADQNQPLEWVTNTRNEAEQEPIRPDLTAPREPNQFSPIPPKVKP